MNKHIPESTKAGNKFPWSNSYHHFNQTTNFTKYSFICGLSSVGVGGGGANGELLLPPFKKNNNKQSIPERTTSTAAAIPVTTTNQKQSTFPGIPCPLLNLDLSLRTLINQLIAFLRTHFNSNFNSTHP